MGNNRFEEELGAAFWQHSWQHFAEFAPCHGRLMRQRRALGQLR
jgi:hypothetical protein